MQILDVALQNLRKNFGGMWKVMLRWPMEKADDQKVSSVRQLRSAFPWDSG